MQDRIESYYDELTFQKNTEMDETNGWSCYTDIANGNNLEYIENFLLGNWVEQPNDRTDETDIIPSYRAVGIKNPSYKAGSELPINVVGTDTFKNAVKKVLMDHAQPYINLKFVFDKPGGVLIDNNYTGGGVCRCLGCKTPHISVSSAGQGLVLHEFGHALGMHHEMKNPNIKITWIESVLVQMFGGADFVKSQITTPVSASSVNATPFDKNSVMIYPLPAKTNQEGIVMQGASNYTELDRQWLTLTYGQPQKPLTGTPVVPGTQPPKPGTQPPKPGTQPPKPKPGTQPPKPSTTKPKPVTTKPKPGTTQPKPGTTKGTTQPGTTQPPPQITVSQSWLDSVILLLISLFAGGN